MSQFIQTIQNDPSYIRFISGQDRILPEFSGKNATFDAGGSIGGTITVNVTNPLKSISDYKYTSGVSSQYDYFGYVFDVPISLRGNTAVLEFLFKSNNNTSFNIVAKDVTNNTIIQTTVIPTQNGSSPQFQFLFNVPSTCTQVKIGIQYTGTVAGDTFEFDNLVFGLWTPNVANLTTQEFFDAYGNAANSITAQSTDIPFNTISTSSLSELGKWTSSTTYTAKKKHQVCIYAKATFTTAASRILEIYRNGQRSYLNGATSSTDGVDISKCLELASGEYITIRELIAGGTLVNLPAHHITITAQATSENIVQSWQDGTEWTSYIPANQGFGTLSNSNVKWKRDGSDLLLTGYFTSGTYSSGEARIYFPTGLVSSSTLPTLSMADGSYVRVASRTSHGGVVLREPSVNYITFSVTDVFGSADVSPFTKLVATSLAGTSGDSISFSARIPIQGWSAAPTLLALPVSKDNNKTYDLTQVSLTSSDATISNGEGTFYPYRTISKTTGLPVWRLAFNVGVTTNSLSSFSLKISGITSPNKLQSVTNASADGGTVANIGVFLASGNTINIAAGAPKTTWRISGDVELASKPTWADEWVEPGVFVGNVAKNQVAYIKDVKASGTNGGTFTSGAWQTRDLNTVEGDTSIASLATNVFTLQPGEYLMEVQCPGFAVNSHQCGIALSGSSTPDVAVGSSENSYTVTQTYSFAYKKVSISTPTAYKILHRCSTTGGTNGFGPAAGFGAGEVYTQIKITKLNGQ